MIERKLIEQIEGEAELFFELKAGSIDFATISFPHFRGMEQILQGKEALDALVYTPRVCGICGHSHLFATVRALEDALQNSGVEVSLSPKAQSIREITLSLELIQNHFKWLYLVITPALAALLQQEQGSAKTLKGAYGASLCNKAAALLSGQWPHSAYMLPGGVTCDPTHVDVMRIESFVDEALRFFENEVMGVDAQKVLDFSTCKEFNAIESDVTRLERMLIETQMHEKGHAYDRFMVMGEHAFATPARLKRTVPYAFDALHVRLEDAYAPQAKSHALNALYKGAYYEGGPLARAISSDMKLIKNMHRRYKDSSYSRVIARVLEIPSLLLHVKHLLRTLDLNAPSYVPPNVSWCEVNASGRGVVEAPRGPLIHELLINNGVIETYRMITPTQWNLGSSDKNNPGVAQKAMLGLHSAQEAQFVFKSFDVCSVCTTH